MIRSGLLACVLTSTLAFAGTPTKIEPERRPLPPSSVLLDAPGFRFVMGRGSGQEGFDTFIVDDKGNAQMIYNALHRTKSYGRIARFALTPEELESVKQLLIEIDYLKLPRFESAGVADGYQSFVKVSTSTLQKGVELDNVTPAPIERLSKLVDDLLNAHAKAPAKKANTRALYEKLVGSEHF